MSKNPVNNAFWVTRRVWLAKPCPDELAELAQWPAMVTVKQRGRRLTLTYDASELQWPDIAQRLVLTQGGLSRALYRWYGYVDDNVRANAQAKGGHCCNKPPPTGRPKR